MRNMRRLAVLLLVALPGLIAAPVAQAGGPTIEKVFVSDTFVDSSCGFPVQFQIVGYQGVLEWTTRDGSIRRFDASNTAWGKELRICAAPWTSMSLITLMPAAKRSSMKLRGVP